MNLSKIRKKQPQRAEQPSPEQQNQNEQSQEQQTPVQADSPDEQPNPDEKQIEAWLRRIPDDPGGLLRRKFEQQEQQRNRPVQQGDKTW